MLTVSKPASLVQQKKQQWAREREEMSHLYLPWGSGKDRYSERLQVRNQFASSLELHKESSYEYHEPVHRQRSPSLPPIRNQTEQTALQKGDTRRSKEALNRNLSSAKRFVFYDEDCEGDTSGYGSETVNVGIRKSQSDVLHENVSNDRNPVIAWQQQYDENRSKPINDEVPMSEGVWSARSPRSVTTEEGRPRWGDRGVATGRLWEPTAPTARLPQMQNQKKGTPSWVERGLNMIENAAEVLLIDQTSSTNSGIDCDRSSYNGSDEGKSFLRGQNVPIEPEVKAQRENKRLKALELQSAILNQLEDREKRKHEERERRLKEEKMEELRIQRQEEEDRLRFEEEKRKNEEKQRLEQRKLETLKKALEDAEKKARQEKEKRFLNYRQKYNNSMNECKTQISKDDTIPKNPNAENDKNINSIVKDSPTKTHRTYDTQSTTTTQNINNNDINSQQATEFNSPRSVGTGNLNFYVQSVPPLSLSENQFSIVPIGINGDIINTQQNGLQLAVLVPQSISSSLYNVSLNSINSFTDSMDSTTKVLTPRKYRNMRCKDASTQTELNMLKYMENKTTESDDMDRNFDNYQNIDENAPQDSTHNNMKKDRRIRSEERFKKDLENRPKWGVNRPAAQYKKQSEKDPFYSQKRKMRQKHRPQPRQYLSQSSDDSRSPSPPLKLDTTENTRNSLSQSYWRSKRSNQESFKSNNEMSEDNTTIHAECNVLEQMTGHDINEHKKSVNIKFSPTKRMTLSQKFINDKYGNKKLWNDEISADRNVKSSNFDSETRKKIIDQLNIAKRDFLERLDDHDSVITKK